MWKEAQRRPKPQRNRNETATKPQRNRNETAPEPQPSGRRTPDARRRPSRHRLANWMDSSVEGPSRAKFHSASSKFSQRRRRDVGRDAKRRGRRVPFSADMRRRSSPRRHGRRRSRRRRRRRRCRFEWPSEERAGRHSTTIEPFAITQTNQSAISTNAQLNPIKPNQTQ